jgi:glycosyltransferase involved in cell wall biosynthesis
MHVLFFNRSYYPDTTATGQILTDLCEELVAAHGCRVTVVAGTPLQPAHGVAIARRETHNGVEILRARGTRFAKSRFIGRATNYVTYFLSACWTGLGVRGADVVVALTDPPIIGLAGWLAARRRGVPLVMAFQDLFPEVTVLLDDFHSDAVDAMLQAVNRFLCRRATRIVALGETMRTRLIENKGAPADRTSIIPSGADTHAITPGAKDNAFARAHGLERSFVVMHSGNLGLSQNLETLVEAAALLSDVPDLVVVFQGDGVRRPALEARARTLNLANVRFLPFAPKESLAESFAAADIFVVSLQAGLAGYIVPSKLYGILASGRPYVAAVEDACEVAAITRAHACGLVTAPGHARALADRILEFYRDRDLTARAGVNARAASLAFDRSLQVAKYMQLFRDVASPRDPSAILVSQS